MKVDRDGAREGLGSRTSSAATRRGFGRGRDETIGLRLDFTARFFIAEHPRRANRKAKHSARPVADQARRFNRQNRSDYEDLISRCLAGADRSAAARRCTIADRAETASGLDRTPLESAIVQRAITDRARPPVARFEQKSRLWAWAF
jgi:hypothetical protein